MRVSFLFSLLLLLLICSSEALGQHRKSRIQDVLYLHNGWVIRGWVMSNDTEDSIRIETIGRNIFVFGNDEIRYRAEEPMSRRGGRKPYIPAPVEKGYYGYIQMKTLSGSSRWGANTLFDISTGHGVRLSHLVGLGGGAGFSFMPQGVLMPIFVEGRSQLSEVGSSFFVSGKAGYSVPLYQGDGNVGWGVTESRVYGGVMGELDFGIRIPTPRNMAWLFSIGYRIQQNREYFAYEWRETIDRRVSYRRLGIGLGIEL